MMIIDLTDILEKWAADTVNEIKANLDSTGTTASGRTRDSVEYIMTDDGVKIIGRPYFRSVEQGRPGGKVPYNFTDIIAQWMEDKGIGTGIPKEDRTMAYFISKKIKEEGTRLYRTGGRDDVYTSVLEQKIAELGQQLSYFLRESIMTDLNK